MAWAADDSEIWFSSTDEQSGNFNVVRAVSLAGKVRVVLRAPGNIRLHDVASDGCVLISTDDSRYDVTLAK